MATIFNVQADVIAGYKEAGDIIRSVLEIGLSDDVHPTVVSYLDHLGSWLGASPRSMEMVRAAVCLHGSAMLRRLGLVVGIKPLDTARLLADCSGGVAWLTWEVALLECYSHEEVAKFQQEAGRLLGLKSVVVPHMRELVSALAATAPRLGTLSFPEHYAKICGSMRQALFAATEISPPQVAEPPLIGDVEVLLVNVAQAYKEQCPIVIRGQRSIGWLAATLTWVYGEVVEVLAAGRVILAAEERLNKPGLPAMITVELSKDESAILQVHYRMDERTLVATLTTQTRQETLTSFGPKRSRANEYFTNWLNCTSPIGVHELGPLSAACAQFTCGLLRTIHVTNEGGETGLRAETQRAGKQLVNVLKLPGAYSDVRRVREFFALSQDPQCSPPLATSQLQLILRAEQMDGTELAPIVEGASTTALAFLARVPSLREVYGRMIRELLRIGVRDQNECSCVLPGSGPEAFLPSAHEPHCSVYQVASLAVEMIAACISSLFIEGPTPPRLTMFHASPLRWAISKAIEQSVLTGSALISGADLMKSILVVAGYSGDYGYGPLIVSSGGQALVLAALNDLTLSTLSVGRVLAFPGAVIHRNQYYDRLVVPPCRKLGGSILRMSGEFVSIDKNLEETNPMIHATDEGAAEDIVITIRETTQDLQLIVRSMQADKQTFKEHDLWHCITAALTAEMVGDCRHQNEPGYTPRKGERICLVGTGTNLRTTSVMSELTFAMVHGRPFDRLLACGVGVNMVVQTTGCLHCAVAACKQLGYSYIIC